MALTIQSNPRRPPGPKVKLIGGRNVINLASYSYYNTISSPLLQERAVQILRTYGVGACGPPNFYGTQDVHMDCEREIARFLGVPAAIIYAQAFSTISSVIPAFCKRGDIIVADRGVNFSIQKGLQISRSMVRWFNHNDMADLERVLENIAKEQRKKKLTRRFIVTEGLFENTGDMPDLPCLIELKTRFKYRVILDETHSFGVLGDSGRGLTEHQHVDPNNVEMIIGSLSHALCAGGGFCAGSIAVVEHQRISSNAYVFSAALPAMLAITAAESIKFLEANSLELIAQLRENVRLLRAQLERSEHIVISSTMENPRVLFCLKKMFGAQEEKVLMDIVDEALLNGVLIIRIKHVKPNDESSRVRVLAATPRNMISCNISTGHTKKDVETAGAVVRKAVGKVLGRVKVAKA